ncbi:unnamed protein product [Bursaphelenchus okinawaensis]|uniref:Uncharacterized protein n=1 Tax=Bursaphelenchus okinawaensis TaxID=465554 RepID=A0A811KAZ7_9BILA|nr:unnamed protein product [Bursaphelenchus okinawaensis]CAG9096382.1 unnamed protein product [Bursaphelenchus okinawaensis]
MTPRLLHLQPHYSHPPCKRPKLSDKELKKKIAQMDSKLQTLKASLEARSLSSETTVEPGDNEVPKRQVSKADNFVPLSALVDDEDDEDPEISNQDAHTQTNETKGVNNTGLYIGSLQSQPTEVVQLRPLSPSS